MEKRLLLSMVLCLLILLAYQSYVEKQNERWKAAHPEMEGEGLQETAADLDGPDPNGVVASKGLAEEYQEQEEELGDALQDVRCEEVVVDTPLYQAVFCSRNGRPMRWTLKNYQLNKACECPVQIPGLRKKGPVGRVRWGRSGLGGENPRPGTGRVSACPRDLHGQRQADSDSRGLGTGSFPPRLERRGTTRTDHVFRHGFEGQGGREGVHLRAGHLHGGPRSRDRRARAGAPAGGPCHETHREDPGRGQ